VTTVAGLVAERIRHRGPIPFDEVMDLALYDPDHGFYSHPDRGAGRRGDFLTSAEVGPLFGAVVAAALDSWWQDLGCPDPFVTVDAGAGPGTLARSVLAAGAACAPALRYVLVERSVAQRRRHRAHLPLVEPAQALAPRLRPPDSDDDDVVDVPAGGPVAVSLPDVPRVPVHVVLANELLDNLPIRLLERADDGWREVRVGLSADGDDLVEVLVPLDAANDIAAGTAVGARVPVQAAAVEWLRGALAAVAPTYGRVVVFDYASTTEALAARPTSEWLRTYRAHGRGGTPLDALGEQDITCEVAVDQLARVRAPSSDIAQADWLRAHGIDALVEEGRRVWEERAPVGDLDALRARSRVREAEALTDAGGLGAFRVLEWTR
jgi:SAM-dependent MidA family methyltransferase